MNLQRNGEGTYTWNSTIQRFKQPAIFTGHYENGQRTHGTLRYPDGSVYAGNFLNGLRQGKGTYTYNDGQVYSGEWVEDLKHGNGEWILNDGSESSIVGHWSKGKFCEGVWTYADRRGNVVKADVLKNGRLGKYIKWQR